MSTLLTFEKLHNTRDLGGARVQNGRVIKPGKLIRSGHLSDLPEADAAKIARLVDTVIDFRTDGELTEQPDTQILGASYYHIPIMEALVSGITHEQKSDENMFKRLIQKPKESRSYMCELYQSFAENDFSVTHYAEFVQLLLRPRHKGVLFHCTGGKDRAGIASVIVESLLGVSREDIIADYLLTNECQAGELTFYMDRVKQETGISGPETDEALNWLFCAHREYIDSFYAAIDARYGSLTNFVWEGLKLTDGDVGWLRDEYLEARS